MGNWHFSEQRPDDVDDETTVSKNFERESRKLSGIFVREFFQNVLDARVARPDGSLVTPHVRISLCDQESGLPATALAGLLDGLHSHLKEAGHDPALWESQHANALVLEELGTSGLIGNTCNSRAKGPEEHWANFWFGEGKRRKGGRSLGRAGQGKITYHIISGTRTVFAVTRQKGRTDDLLFGKCIVQKTHELGGKHYKRHGYWPETGIEDQPLPSSNTAEIDDLKKVFSLKRKDETGTSWVIPYVSTESFSKKHLISEILRDFFFSILAEELTVEVMDTEINSTNLVDLIKEYGNEELPIDFVSFLEEALTLPDDSPEFIQAAANWYGAVKGAPLSEDAISDGDLERARAALDSQKMVAVRLPVPLTPRGGGKVTSEIRVFLKKPDQIEKTREIYVRSGLVIGEEQHLRDAPGRYFGLMLAKETPISEFLGFAEEASHMRWNTTEEEVTKRYKKVTETIASVRHSLPKLARLLIGHTSGRLDDALIDFLSIPAAGDSGRKVSTTKKKKKPETPERPEIPKAAVLRRFRVNQTGSTWKLKPGPDANKIEYPVTLRIELAYATMPGEGNPFKVYHRFEFDLSNEKAYPVSIHGGTVQSRDQNRLELELTGADFELTIDGFSEHALKSRIIGALE